MAITSMVRQQAKLVLEEEYPNALGQAEQFVKYILAKNIYDKNRLLSGEGSASAMVDSCLATITYNRDVTLGIKEYYRYLTSEYDRRHQYNNWGPLDLLVDTEAKDDITLAGEDTSSDVGRRDSLADALGASPLPSSAIRIVQEMSQAELEVFETLASIGGGAGVRGGPESGGGIREVAVILDRPRAEVERAYRRVRARVRAALAAA